MPSLGVGAASGFDRETYCAPDALPQASREVSVVETSTPVKALAGRRVRAHDLA